MTEVEAAVRRLRRALEGVLAGVGADVSEPQEVSRRLGLDKTLTWRLSRVVGDDDPWAAATHIPRRPSFRLVAEALVKHGAPDDQIAALWEAVDDYERLVERHAGDREMLEIMVSGVSMRSAEKRLELFRKSGYQANASIWGVSARVQVSARFLVPSAEPGALDILTICGFAGFRRLRADAPWAVAYATSWDMKLPDGMVREFRPKPLVGLGPDGDVPILPQFCTSPTPEVRVEHDGPRSTRYVLPGGPVGNTAAADVILGYGFRGGASMRETYAGEKGEHGMRLSTPAELAIQDLYIHSSLDFGVPTSVVYGQLPGGPQYPAPPGQTAVQLPVPTETIVLGRGEPDPTCREFPAMVPLVEQTAAWLRTPLGDFRGYRVKLKYPPIPTMLLSQHRLMPAT
jgi:hypothetical protein